MARVVSWRVDFGSTTKYAYITDGDGNAPLINGSQLDQSTANRIGSIVLGWDRDKYSREFEKMQIALDEALPEHIDLGSANKYWNITEYEEGGLKQVLMLVGADGKNTSEELSSYYTFHLVNQAVAIGTGSDYRLDKNAVIQMEAFFMDRNGNKFPCDGGISVDGTSFSVGSLNHTSESTIFDLTIVNGTSFSNDTHSIECVIVGTKAGGGEGKSVFTATAVLGGKEGVSYDLIVAPKQFHFNSPQEVAESTGKVNVGVLMNGKQLTKAEMTAEGLTVGYEYDVNGQNGFYDNEDITTGDVDGNGRLQISPSSIYEHGGTIAFYLMSNGTVVDSDSASVVVDGEDGLGTVTIELDNEVEAVGVGDDNDLDLPDGVSVTASTNVRMYSGETSLIIEHIDVIDATVNSGKGEHWDEYPIVADDMIDGNGDYYGTIRIVLKNGFEFGDDLRDKITLNITGRHPGSGTLNVTKTCAFTIIGVKGGEDGVLYRLTPSCDYIMYDPNAGMIQCEDSEPFPASDISNRKISALATEGNYMKSPAAILADQERVTYTIGVTHSSALNAYNAQAAEIDGMRFTAPLSEVLGDLSNPTSRYITFYWTKLIGSEYYLIDRETVPVITAGLDGRFAKIELGNEVDAITVGDDSKLDIESETVEVGTSIRAVAPDLSDLDILSVNAEVIQDYDGWHSDTTGWPSVNLEVSDDGGETWGSVDGQPHKKWRFFYILPNGFDFGDDRKEKVKLDVRYKLEDDTEHTGSAIFTIVGVPGGKEGQRYALVPEVDIIRYFANDDLFDEETLICDAVLGLEKLDGGHIYYGERIRTEQGYRVLDIIDSNFKNYYEEGNSVQVRDMYFGTTGNRKFTGPTNQIAFYLTIDTDKGEMIVDHETVSIVSDGKDGDPNIKVELSNEIESISTGTDTSLGDMKSNEYVTAHTSVYVVRGSDEKVEMCGFSYEWLDNVESGWFKAAPKLYKRSAEDASSYGPDVISETNRSKYADLEIVLNRNFDFGSEMRKRLILVLSYKDEIGGETKKVRGLYTLVGIKGGKDGMVFKIQPTPDFVGFDLQTQEWAGNTSEVSAFAFLNGNRLNSITKPGSTEKYREGVDYEIKITRGVVYDLDSAAQQWNTGTFTRYTEGAGVGFGEPSATAREQSIVFYLKFGDKVVDRESVPLYINGKEGKDGEGSIIFDVSNENWLVTTGEDTILNISNSITGGTYVTCSSGHTYASIHIDTGSTDAGVPSSLCVVSIEDNDTPSPFIKVTLKKNFDFGSNQKKTINITARTLLDGFTGSPVFNMVCVKNGKGGTEGISYDIKTSAGSIVYDTGKHEYIPKSLEAVLYKNTTAVTSTNYILKVYRASDDNPSGTQTGQTITKNNAGRITLDIGSFNGFPEVGMVRISALTENNVWDGADIPIVCSGKDGSGIVFDLTNDRDTIALGGDLILDTNVNLGDSAVGTVWQGSTQLPITNCSASVTAEMSQEQKNKVHVTASIVGGNSVVLNVSLDSGLDFGSLEGHQIPVMITATATDIDGNSAVKEVKYTIHGFQGGEDGHVYRIVPTTNVIKYNGEDNVYVPSTISATFTDNGVEHTEFYMKLGMDKDDGTQIIPVEYQENSSLDISRLVTVSGLNNFLTFYAYESEGGRLLDKESVPVVYDGHDGLGGIEAVTDPKFINVNVDEFNKVKSAHEYNIRVGLMSGDSVTNCTITSSVVGFESGNVTVTVGTNDGDGYKKVKINVPQGADLGSDGTAYITFTCKSTVDTSKTRNVSFYFYAASGGRGARGPLTRIRDYTTGDTYQSGAENETYLDFIYYGTDTFKGGFFECKKSQGTAPATPPKITNGEWDDSDPNWTYYPTADFVASKVASFGNWPNGWVIDEGKIQHTTSSITLDADGAIIVKEPAWTAHKYTSGSYEIYVPDMAYEDGESVMAYSGGTVGSGNLYNNYSALTDGSYIVSTEKDSSGNNKIELSKTDKTTVACYLNTDGGLYQSGSKTVLMLTQPVSRDIYAAVGFRAEPTIQEYKKYECRYVYKIPAGTTEGILVSATENEITTSSSGIRMRVMAQQACYSISDPELDSQTADDTLQPICAIRTVRAGAPTVEDAIYCDDCGSNCYSNCASYCNDSCSSYCSANESCLRDTSNLTIGRFFVNTGNTALNGSSGTATVVYNDIIDSSTYRTSCYFRFISGTGDSGTASVLATATTTENIYFSSDMSSANVILGNGDVPQSTERIYTRQNTTVRLASRENALSQVKISSVPYGDNINPVISIGNGITKFFADGRMETTSGKFTGSIYAEDGVFNGSAYINEGTLNNVKVNGDVNLNGNNYFRMFDGNGKQRVEISNQKISTASLSQNSTNDTFPVNTSFTATDTKWVDGKTYTTNTEELMSTYKFSEDKIIIPEISFSYDFSYTKKSRSLTIVAYVENPASGKIGLFNGQTATTVTSESGVKKTNAMTITSGSGHYKVKFYISGKFNKKLFGHTAKLTVTISSTTPIKVEHKGSNGNQLYFDKFTVGTNGFSYSTDNGGIMMISHESANNTAILLQSKLNGNGLYIDNDEFLIRANGITYNMINVLSTLGSANKDIIVSQS